MTSESLTLLGMAGSLLAVAITSAWKMSALVAQQQTMNRFLSEEREKLDARLRTLDAVPEMKVQIGQLQELHRRMNSTFPAMLSRLSTLEAQAQHSKEWRRISRPDLGGKDD